MNSSTVTLSGASGKVFIFTSHEGVIHYAQAKNIGYLVETVEPNRGNNGGVYCLSVCTSGGNFDLIFEDQTKLNAAITLIIAQI